MTEQPITPEQATTTPPPTKPSWFEALVRDRTRAWILLAALCIPAGTIVILAVRGTNPTAAVGNVLPAASIASVDPGPLMALEATLQAAQTALRRYQYQLKDVADIHVHLQHEIEAWQNEIEPTLKSERGQFLAAQPDLVRRFSTVYRSPRFKQADLEAARTRARELARPIDDALGGRGTLFNPDEDERRTLAAQIQEERELAQDALSAIRQARNSAVALLDHGKTLGKKAEFPLVEAMEQDQKSLAFDIAQKTASLQEQAEREAAEKEAAALADQTRQLGEMRAAAIEADTKRKIKEQQEETARNNRTAERERLEKLAADPDVIRKFQPFLAKGNFRFIRTEPIRWSQIPGPCSLSDLHRMGSLNNVEAFAGAASGQGFPVWSNDRPKWKEMNTEKDYAEYERRYKLFLELAPIWVEKGILAR